MDIQYVIEAALLAHPKGLQLEALRALFGNRVSTKRILMALNELKTFWDQRGLRLVEDANGAWQFRTASEVQSYLLNLVEEKPAKYSRAAMETLAIIAYRQPVTRGDIEAIRGVAVNPNILRQFEDRGWIEVVGYRETPGRPALLGTTDNFLADLNLKNLQALPNLDLVNETEFELGLATPEGQEETAQAQPVQQTLLDIDANDEQKQSSAS